METFIGFDSAWAGSAKAPGAIAAITLDAGTPIRWHAPQLVGFDEALCFINKVTCESHYRLIAIDQPTIVPNLSGGRPVERLAGSLVSWNGGGTQSSSRSKLGLFCDNAPIWSFLENLGAAQCPEVARTAAEGSFLLETYPAAGLPTIVPSSFLRKGALKYNPANPKFRIEDWRLVANAAATEALAFSAIEVSNWCKNLAGIARPRKCDQDMLDSVICLLIGLRWRLRPRTESIMLGDLQTGYMIIPASQGVREYLVGVANTKIVPVDGAIPPAR